MSWLLVLGLLIAFYLGFLVYLSGAKTRYESNLETALLRVAISRTNERGPIVAEQIFSSLHAIGKNYTFWDLLSGHTKPRISLEVASVKNVIYFFIWTPKRFKSVIENQIYAQYPDIEIEEVPDYAAQPFAAYADKIEAQTEPGVITGREITPYGSTRSSTHLAVTAELQLHEPMIFPIKRYSQFEDKLTRLPTESLAGITATLASLNATDEQAWIQIVIEPVGDWWRKRGLKCLRIISKGLFNHIFWLHTLATNIYLARGFWRRTLFSPLYFLFWVLRGFHTGDLPMKSSGHDLKEEVSRSHDREDPISAAVDKVTRQTFDVNIRIVYILRKENEDLASIKLNEIAGSFGQFNLPNMNSFVIHSLNQSNAAILRRYQKRSLIHPMLLNVEEVATLYHMPHKDVGVPNIFWLNSKKMEPPHNLPIFTGGAADSDLNKIGTSNFRGRREHFGIKTIDRRRHLYIIGKTGMGKSVLLENMIFSDVLSKKGLAVIDPHGDLADSVINFVPSFRTNDVVVLDPSDVSHPFAFNMLEGGKTVEQKNLLASGLLGVFKKMYAESWGPRLEHILRNCLLTLTENPNTSMLGIMRLLVDDKYRKQLVSNVSNPLVRSFWEDEFGKMQDRMRTEAISPIQNKVGQFLSSPMIRNIVGQVRSTVNIRFMMDSGKIVIVNLSKGKIGEDNSSLLGSMLITKFQIDAMSRADTKEEERKDFYLYVDEFQNFATDAFATILSEARKYRLSLIMANQYIAQMPEEVRDAVFGNVGSLLSFQVGFDDAEYFSNQYGEAVLPNDIVSLPKYNAYMKLLVDGMPSQVFSLGTLPPPEIAPEENRRETIIRLSRERYCTPREVVEDKILRWSESNRLETSEKPERLLKPSEKTELPKHEKKAAPKKRKK